MKIDINFNEVRTATEPSILTRPVCNHSGRKGNMEQGVKAAWDYLQHISRPIRLFRVNAATIVGKEKHSGELLKIVYFGETEQGRSFRVGKIYTRTEASEKYSNYQYTLDSIYSGFKIIKEEKNVDVFGIEKHIERYEPLADMILIDAEAAFLPASKKAAQLVVPQQVPQRLHIAESWEAVYGAFSRNLRKELRRILKRGYQYFVSTSEEHFEQFYHGMYLPYTRSRFGHLACPNMSRAVRRGLLDDGEIHFLLQDGRVLLGVLQKYRNHRMTSTISATIDNLSPDRIKGAFTAMDYFSILDAFERGIRVIDFMGSRPFLKDGPFRYKRKWGASVGNFRFPMNDLCLRLCNFGPGVRSFFSNNPMIVKKGKEYVGKVLLTKTATRSDMEYCLKNHSTRGLAHIGIFCLDGIDREANVLAHDNSAQIKLFDISNSPCPEMDFCGV